MRYATRDHEAYFGNDDATPERLRKAREAGLQTPVEDILLHTGMPSGARRRQIESPFQVAYRREWIQLEDKEAGERFLYHYAMSHPKHGYSSQKWEMPVDGGRREDYSDSSLDHLRILHHALLAIHYPKYRDAFSDWIREMNEGDTSVAEFGAKIGRLAHHEGKKGAAITALELILNDLAEHFGFKSKQSSWDTRRQLERLLKR